MSTWLSSSFETDEKSCLSSLFSQVLSAFKDSVITEMSQIWDEITVFLAQLLCGLDDATRDLSQILPVFPEAQGFGTDTPAGRGGTILLVENLDTSGPGSLRQALEQDVEGPRTVLFNVSGNIWLTSDIEIRHPYVTVAGQTAPSPGITLAGAGITVRTHDVLIQHVRIRPGDRKDGPKPKNRDAITLADPDVLVHHVVIDHCSLSWAIDEVASIWYDSEDITFSNNIIAEGLADSLHPEGSHSKGLLIGDGARRVSVLGNLFAHNYDRNPVLKSDTSALVVNNLVYDPGLFAMVHYGNRFRSKRAIGSFHGNAVIPGLSTPANTPAVRITKRTKRKSSFYVSDSGTTQDDRRRGSWATAPNVAVSPLTVYPSSQVEATVTEKAGSRPLDRDPVDTRIIQQVFDRVGGIIDSQDNVGGWPDLVETSIILDLPEDPSGDLDGDGYTNLEEWLHSLSAALV